MTARTPVLELALGGDVMVGRGIDQVLPHPSSPELFEDYIRDARDYVRLAEARNGSIDAPVSFSYPWGDALGDLQAADVRVVNLETSVTTSDQAWPEKGINYRMHPANMPCLTAAAFDVVTLANNHVLDWGRRGLLETLQTLEAAGMKTAGAGRTKAEAEAPAIRAARSASSDGSSSSLFRESRRVIVVATAEPESGVPASWEAKPDAPGIAISRELDDAHADALARRLERVRRDGDVAVVSIHWGPNWGYVVDDAHVRFAHALVERGVDVVFGHSSHHPRPIEIHRGKPIFYGCGDLIDDYEGIAGYEAFRNELVLLYLLTVDERGGIDVRMKPFRIRKMRLERAAPSDAEWLAASLSTFCKPHGSRVFTRADGALGVRALEGDA